MSMSYKQTAVLIWGGLHIVWLDWSFLCLWEYLLMWITGFVEATLCTTSVVQGYIVHHRPVQSTRNSPDSPDMSGEFWKCPAKGFDLAGEAQMNFAYSEYNMSI